MLCCTLVQRQTNLDTVFPCAQIRNQNGIVGTDASCQVLGSCILIPIIVNIHIIRSPTPRAIGCLPPLALQFAVSSSPLARLVSICT